ncbi:MAG: hypothetical protein EXX96DRAFT_555079 [Benjaminiella poitrasii]|nr:MAG: hypothetical protein EXX96DRAFT_555079 [Benjaminiella poitrasii]
MMIFFFFRVYKKQRCICIKTCMYSEKELQIHNIFLSNRICICICINIFVYFFGCLSLNEYLHYFLEMVAQIIKGASYFFFIKCRTL